MNTLLTFCLSDSSGDGWEPCGLSNFILNLSRHAFELYTEVAFPCYKLTVIFREEDCKTLSGNNALSSLAILGDSCQIKRTLRHEIKPFSSGIAQRIEEDYVAARSAWGAEAEAIRQDRRRNGSYNNVPNFQVAPDLHSDEYRYIDSSNNSSKHKRYGVVSNAKGNLILEHATSGPKQHYNFSSGEQKAPQNVQFRRHLPQSPVHVSQPRRNELRSINRVGGSTLSLDQLLPNATQPVGLLANKTKEKKMEKTFKLDDDNPIKQMEKDVADFVESSTLNQTQLAKCTAPEESITKADLRERLESIYDKVFIVDSISVAKEVVNKLTNDFRDFIHACDTEACLLLKLHQCF